MQTEYSGQKYYLGGIIINEKLASRLELLVANYQNIKKDFVWQNTYVKRLAALLYTVENKSIDCNSIRECYELIKKNTGAFSTFRGNMAIGIATMLSLSPDKESQISNMLDVYKMMKGEGFRASDFLVIAAYQIAASSHADNYRNTIERARAFYDGMKENHWFNTGYDDYIFSAMLGLSDIDIRDSINRMQQLYEEFKQGFISGNDVQTLAQVLVLGGETPETVARVRELWQTLKERNLRLDKMYTLSSIGVLALLPDSVNTIADNISEAHDYLKGQKGFGTWSVNKAELLLFVASVVTFDGVEQAKRGVLTATLSTSLINIIIAHQAAAGAAT